MNIDDRRPTPQFGKFQMAITLQRVPRSPTTILYPQTLYITVDTFYDGTL